MEEIIFLNQFYMTETSSSEVLKKNIKDNNILEFHFRDNKELASSLHELGQSDIAEADVSFEGSINFENDEYVALVEELEGKSIEEKRKILQQVIRWLIANLKTAVVLSQAPTINTLKQKIESEAKKPFTAEYINTLLEKLPGKETNDAIGRAYVLQYLWGKLRANGYIMTVENGSVKLLTNNAKDLNILPFTDTINSYIRAWKIDIHDCMQAIMIGSGTIGEYMETRKANPADINNIDYIDYLKQKYQLFNNFTPPELEGKNIPAEDKALLLSSMDPDFSKTDIKQVAEKYAEMQTQTKEIFDSKHFKTIEKALGATPVDAKDLARRVTEDPSILSGKPLTVLAGGLATIMALGHEKGKWFSLWTGLTRGFMALLALFLGVGVAKEWGMDPKKMVKEVGDMMKREEKTIPAAVAGTPAIVVESSEKPIDKSKLSPSQERAAEKVNHDQDLKSRIEKHIKNKENEQGKLEDYLAFIHSSDFQNQRLSHLVFTQNPEASIFMNSGINALWIVIPPNLSPSLLKRVLRTYITGKSHFEVPALWTKEGEKEKQEFIEKYPQETYKDKTIKELIEENKA